MLILAPQLGHVAFVPLATWNSITQHGHVTFIGPEARFTFLTVFFAIALFPSRKPLIIVTTSNDIQLGKREDYDLVSNPIPYPAHPCRTLFNQSSHHPYSTSALRLRM